MKEITRNSRNYAVGEEVFDVPPSVLKKFTGAEVIFTREAWPAGVDYTNSSGMTYPNIALVCQMFSSLDGVNWQEQFDYPTIGGVIIVRGVESTESRFTMSFSERDGDIRFVVKILVPLRTAVTLRLLEPA